MAAATDVLVEVDQRVQFQGLFSHVWVVHFTLDTANISGNATAEDTVAIPGIKRGDIVLGFAQDGTPSKALLYNVHVEADNLLAVLSHNSSGGNVNPASDTWHVVIGRTIFHNQT